MPRACTYADASIFVATQRPHQSRAGNPSAAIGRLERSPLPPGNEVGCIRDGHYCDPQYHDINGWPYVPELQRAGSDPSHQEAYEPEVEQATRAHIRGPYLQPTVWQLALVGEYIGSGSEARVTSTQFATRRRPQPLQAAGSCRWTSSRV